ncbi:PilZ domain-containing protein [Glaciecola sp. KUL10]|uniref:PilZ domain-containing protein n=1 Tax=Glaciecola sp. (strain KUL10) TaxID=2161813 RepID=UPI000D787B3A|nr:PilZ domain-containing protein [Glaciecola sp. KUL10]GBL03929.1 type IV pilus assembly PilZ [Glaciecola sp. KUL10]
MTEQIEKYQYLIETLAPMAHEDDFHELLAEKAKDCSEETRFLLTMEIKRLAQPCIKSIDLRTLVDDECTLRESDGIEHYISDEGFELYQHLMALYKYYAVGVRDGVIGYFSKQRDIALGKTKREKPKHENTAFSHTYISPIEQLLDFPQRQDERVQLEVEIRVFLSASVLICGKTLDISKRGIKARLDDETELTLIKGYRPVQIVFVGLDKETKLQSTAIGYRVAGISKGQSQAEVHFIREWDEGPKLFNNFIESYLAEQKTPKLIDTENTEAAIETKIYEQAFSVNCPSMSLFVNTEKISRPFVQFACVNDINIEILDYWQDENNKSTIGYLFDKERLKRLILESDSDKSIFIYCFSHTSGGKVYFYSATDYELEKNAILKDVFLSYASRKASWRVYKIVCHQLNTNDAHLPSSLPDGASRESSQHNRPMVPKLVSALSPLSHLLTLSDITHIPGQQCYQQRELEKDKIKLLSVFGHAKNRLPAEIETYKFALLDLRRERRYQLRTDVVVKNKSETTHAVTEDVSVQGLKIELDDAIGATKGATVLVSFTRLQERTKDYDLQELPYRVMHVSDDGYILHLQASENDKSNMTKSFFKMLINKNRDKLSVLSSDNATPGLRQALRVLQARFSPQMCVFTSQQKNLHIPIKVATNRPRAAIYSYLYHRMPSEYHNFSRIFDAHYQGKQSIGVLINQARKHHIAQSSEVFIFYDSSKIEIEDAVTVKWEHDVPTHVEKYRFIKNAIANGEFFACKITALETQKPITTLYDDELNYVRRGKPKLGSRLEALAWNFSGQVFLTDITEEALHRYRLFQQ